MRFARSLVFVIWMYGWMAILGVLALPTLLMPQPVFYGVFAFWRRLMLWGLRVFCGVTWEVRGREFIPRGGVLIAMKHQSMFETFVMWEFLEAPAVILKRALMFLPVFGWYAIKTRNIVIDRSGAAKALRTMLKRAQQRVDEGRQIVIFPQGTRATPGQHYPYKPGVAALYRALEAPCVPIALNSGLHWPAHGIVRTPGHIVFQVLEPIAPGLSRKDFMVELEARLEAGSDALLPNGDAAPAANVTEPETLPEPSPKA